MTRRPEDLSPAGLMVALAVARAIREVDGRLGARMEVANLEREQQRRIEIDELERLWDAS